MANLNDNGKKDSNCKKISCKVFAEIFGNKAKVQISKRVFEESKAR